MALGGLRTKRELCWGSGATQTCRANLTRLLALSLSPLPRAFPSPSTISARFDHEQIEQQERSLASIAFRAREMPGPTNKLSCAYHVRTIYVARCTAVFGLTKGVCVRARALPVCTFDLERAAVR